MDVILTPKKLHGQLDIAKAAPSTSYLHREIICSALAGQTMPQGTSDDTCATRECISAILSGKRECNARESASTLRFLIPLALISGGCTFRICGKLAQRPLSEYGCIDGARIKAYEDRIEVSGTIKSGTFVTQGDISSQFVSGLMFALPLLSGDSEIRFEKPLQSADYALMTADVLSHYGIEIKETEQGFFIKGNQHYMPSPPQAIEGDLSYAANFIVANALGAEIDIKGLNTNSLQPDRRIFEMLDKDVCDVSQCPDLFPILCVASCGRTGRTDIINAGRVRLKESDRISAMVTELTTLGADIRENADGVTIYGKGFLQGGEVHSHNDHRVAFALTVAALCLCRDKVVLHGAECVRKSAPEFFGEIERLIDNA